MGSPNLIAPVVTALEAAGAILLDQDKAAIEALIDPLADSDAEAVMNALASHITMNGLAGMVQAPLRNAITGSEPTVAGIINANVAGGFDALETWLQKVSAEAQPT